MTDQQKKEKHEELEKFIKLPGVQQYIVSSLMELMEMYELWKQREVTGPADPGKED